MSQTPKVLVTTVKNDTLRDFVCDAPYWIGENYGHESSEPDHAKWDIVIMSDGVPDLNTVPYQEPASVIWLKHRGTTPEHSALQHEWFERVFPQAQLELVLFSHGNDNNLRYFNLILALGKRTDSYSACLTKLHQRLLGQDLTQQAVTFLYSLALAMELKRSSPEGWLDAADATEDVLNDLKKSLARFSSKGIETSALIDHNMKGFFPKDSCVSTEEYRAIRDSLHAICTS